MTNDLSSTVDRPQVTVVGLGPAGPDLCTTATLTAIADHPHRLVRTIRHPAVAVLGDHVVALDHHYESADSFAEVYAGVVDEVVMAAEAHARVLYAVPGSPMVAERTVELLLADDRVEVSVVPALSFVDLAWVRLGVDPLTDGVRIVDAHRFSVEASGERGPLLVAQVDTPTVLADVVVSVEDPPSEPVTVLQGLGTDDERISRVPWNDLPAVIDPDHLTSLFVPRLAAPIAVEMQRFVELVAMLRYECPWDAEQTHTTLRSHLLEEAHELLEALDGYDEATGQGSKALEEELGDLLFQVVFHARMAEERGLFGFDDVASIICDKMEARHPHIFGGSDGTMDEARWETLKAQEREAKGQQSAMDGVARALPALLRAEKLQKRAARVGFEWHDTRGPREKLEELGFNLVIVPGDLQRTAIFAMQQAAEAILKDGHTESLVHMMASFDDREAAVNTSHYMELDDLYAH